MDVPLLKCPIKQHARKYLDPMADCESWYQDETTKKIIDCERHADNCIYTATIKKYGGPLTKDKLSRTE